MNQQEVLKQIKYEFKLTLVLAKRWDGTERGNQFKERLADLFCRYIKMRNKKL